jgi:hypothetical protein
MNPLRLLVICSTMAAASPAFAQIVIDGTRDAAYGPALAIQTVNTEFGDNGSEWNAGYARLEAGQLKLMLTGNLEFNFNKLEIFIDSRAGGQAVFDSSGNDNAGVMDGLVFDAPFTADFHLIARRGFSKFDLDFANLTAQSASGYFDVFGGTDFGAATTGTGVNAMSIAVAYNGSNAAGIGGGTGAADQNAAAAVTTGLELGIALADLGYAGGPVRIMVGQANQNHDYWSNQFLGGIPTGWGNLMGPGTKDFTQVPGDQFFTVVPEPTALALLAIAAGAAAARRRRLAAPR